MKKPIVILFLIMLFGSVIRLLYLGQVPSGLFRDEAALGYNAYSLAKTGADEFGIQLPLVFRSFEVFFLPLYGYLSVPVMWILGLSEFSTRLLSAVSGILLLFLGFLLGKKLEDTRTGLILSFLLMISPWHIFYSRGAFEGNLALTLFAGGFYFWLRFVEKKKIANLLLTIIFFAFSMYSYQAERVTVFLFAVAALFFERHWFLQNSKKVILPVVIGVVILIPLLSLTLKPGGYHRALGVSVFSTSKYPSGYIEGVNESMLTNNKFFLRGKEIASLYFSYFSPRNLFVEGDYDKQRSVENYSVFYPWIFPFLLFGLVALLRSGNGKYVFTWILIAPIPAALTGDPFHTYRSLLLYFPLTLLAAIGVNWAYEMPGKYRQLLLFAIGSLALSTFTQFIFNYAFLTPSLRARAWDYGYKEVFGFLETQSDYNKVVVDDIRTEPYIHYLFFNKYDPEKYHKVVSDIRPVRQYYYTDSSKIRPNKIENFEFRKVDWPTERGNTGNIFVFSAELLPDSEHMGDPKVKLLKVIYYPDGTPAYKIVKIVSP